MCVCKHVSMYMGLCGEFVRKRLNMQVCDVCAHMDVLCARVCVCVDCLYNNEVVCKNFLPVELIVVVFTCVHC